MRLRRPRVLAAALVALSAFLAPCAGASATTASSVPLTTPWGAWKDCGSSYPRENCATVQATADNSATHTLFLAGNFTKLVSNTDGTSVDYQNLAAIDDRTGTLISAFRAHTFNGMIYAAAVDVGANLLYVGGDFTTVDGSSAGAKRVAAFDMSTGARLTSFDVQANASVRSLLYDGGTKLLYLGGRFTKVQLQPRERLAAVDPVSGILSTSFVPPEISWTETPAVNLTDVRALTIGGDGNGHRMLYVGGHFDKVGGVFHQSLVRVDAFTGALDTEYTPAITATKNDDLQAVDKILWLDGSKDGVPGVVVAQAGHTNRAYRFGILGHFRWSLRPDGDVQTLAMHSGVLYVGGHFLCVARGQTGSSCYGGGSGSFAARVHLAAVDLSTGAILPDFRPQMNPKTAPYYFGVWSLRVVPGGTLWATGVFKQVTYGGKTYARAKVAAFRA